MASNRKLEDYGVIYLAGILDQKRTEEVATKLLELNYAGQSEPIQLIINSPGGDLQDAFALVDLIEWSRRPVRTTGIGVLASAGLLLFMAGEKGNRVLTPKVALMSHRYSWGGFGTYSDLVARRKEEDLCQARVIEHYKKHTKLKTNGAVNKHLLRDVDTWLTAREAVAFGIADRVEHAATRAVISPSAKET